MRQTEDVLRSALGGQDRHQKVVTDNDVTVALDCELVALVRHPLSVVNGVPPLAKKQPSSVDAHVGSRVRLRRMLIGMSQEKLGELLDLLEREAQKFAKLFLAHTDQHPTQTNAAANMRINRRGLFFGQGGGNSIYD